MAGTVTPDDDPLKLGENPAPGNPGSGGDLRAIIMFVSGVTIQAPAKALGFVAELYDDSEVLKQYQGSSDSDSVYWINDDQTQMGIKFDPSGSAPLGAGPNLKYVGAIEPVIFSPLGSEIKPFNIAIVDVRSPPI